MWQTILPFRVPEKPRFEVAVLRTVDSIQLAEVALHLHRLQESLVTVLENLQPVTDCTTEDHEMTLDEFHDHVDVINDRFRSHWRFMSGNNPRKWPLEMDRDEWIELLIQFIENDRQGAD